MTPAVTEAVSPRIRSAWWSSLFLFLIHGLVFSTWVSRIPGTQAKLGLSNAVLGLTLLGTAAGCVVAIPICGWLVNRHGSKRVTAWSTLAFCVTLVPLSFAIDALSLGAALFLFGASAGTMDVAMNAQGVEVEKALGQPTMSRFHGMFSLGAMVAAGAGGLVAANGYAIPVHFIAASTLFLLLSAVASPRMLESAPHSDSERKHALPLRQIPVRLLALCAISFCMLVSEGAMADWTGIYLQQSFAAGPGLAAAGYAVFSGAMALFRFLGDAITAHLGSIRTVRAGSLIATAGLVWSVLAPSAPWVLPGLAAVGIGFSVIVPLVFGAGGRIDRVAPGTGIATVTGFGYVGFLVGPPAIGFISQASSLRLALGLLAVLSLLCAVLAQALGGSGEGARQEVA